MITDLKRGNARLQPQDWTRVLAQYRTPNLSRSLFELAVTFVPFAALWGLAWWALSFSVGVALALSVFNSLFLVRLFMIQHDCGHGAFFKNRRLGDWVGRAIGVLTLTPYDVWRKSHAIHHATTGNLDHRGMGDVPTLTVQEFRNKSWIGRFLYRLVRNPMFLFGIVPFYTFFLQYRLPIGFMSSGWMYWLSALGTNAGIIAVLALMGWLGGASVILLVFFPTMYFAAVIGMWLFYVQHQFEDTVWDRDGDWNIHEAALHGSSYYDLPSVLRWFTADIGAHHVHHLASRVPFYRLGELLRDHDALTRDCRRITLLESLRCARLHLWDENSRRLISFNDARAIPI